MKRWGWLVGMAVLVAVVAMIFYVERAAFSGLVSLFGNAFGRKAAQ